MKANKEQRDRLDWLYANEDQLIAALPHGSGIDATWHVSQLANGNVVCSCSYHGMDEHGYYDGWQEFKIVIHPIEYVWPVGQTNYPYNAQMLDFRLHFTGQRVRRSWTYGLRDYLEDSFQLSLHYLLLRSMKVKI